MSTTNRTRNQTNQTRLDLSRAEEWVVHHAVLTDDSGVRSFTQNDMAVDQALRLDRD
ncbi:hypothetical protein [Haloarchaeobius litoreus]|uniref:Uncharacterized protein n=1 Tax=Haloarchaeobius litoreus TaxID=755306 RepID=A0ABD6DFK1_9EURY|nr:hypothetical protein [Haloarchaeobius litoreus]